MVLGLTTWILEKEQEKLKRTSGEVEAVCLICETASDDLLILGGNNGCKHTFCEACLERRAQLVMVNDTEVRRSRSLLPQTFFVNFQQMRECPLRDCGTAFKDTDVRPYTPSSASQSSSSFAKKAKDSRGFRTSVNQDSMVKWLKKYDDNKLDVIPSAKLRGAMGQLCAWQRDAPDDKVIIFTQWRPYTIMLGSMLRTKRFGFVYFTVSQLSFAQTTSAVQLTIGQGDMSQKQRRKAIDDFYNDPSIKVMVAGLGCGALGLNLTCANRVIIVDPWWNTCV